MFMFRKPGDSSDESSNEAEEEQEASIHDSCVGQPSLSKINTLDSAESSSVQHSTYAPISNSRVRDLLLHSLLEEKALREAALHLNRAQDDPNVQELAHATYQALARQLSGDDDYASEEMKTHRATAQEGLSTITRNHVTALAAVGEDGSSGALVSRFRPLRTLSAISPLFSNLPSTSPIDFLNGFPGLHTDRYVREFLELGVVGRGGYGKVYKVKHKLDNSSYAVKRIVVSSARLQKIQEHGPQEMEKMLEEVRALARFDHGNIVRYHNCWLEFTTISDGASLPSTTFTQEGRLLEGADPLNGGMNDLRLGFDSFSEDPYSSRLSQSGAGIVFETSDADSAPEAKESSGTASLLADHSRTFERRKRRGSQGSQLTIATVSSTRSHLSTIESVNGEDEDDVETIERSHHPQYLETSEMSESMISHSDVPNQLSSTRNNGPVLTLNVQMSLYETNLADFLSTQHNRSMPTTDIHPKHCFHTSISLEVLSNILSGVQYLHAQGVVHRDLKPANIFLSLSTSTFPPSGSVDLSSCRSCPKRGCLHVTPRIGDFGLVAALGHDYHSNTMTKPVGTEFYRPVGGDTTVSEKLDVFALGVVGFELLQFFSTRMERVDALLRLRRDEFPSEFIEKAGRSVRDLLSDMLQADERKRSSCANTKLQLQQIIQQSQA